MNRCKIIPDMNEFNKGWWNCFCSYTEELNDRYYNWAETAKAQLTSARVTKDEIVFVLKEYNIAEKTKVMLREYLREL